MKVRFSKSNPGIRLFVWAFVLFTICTGYTAFTKPQIKKHSAQFVLYLEVTEEFSDEVILHIDSIRLIKTDSSFFTIPVSKIISSQKTASQQIKLIDRYIEPGMYTSALFFCSGIEGYIGKVKMQADISVSGYRIPLLKEATAERCCFVNMVWDVHPFDEKEKEYQPHISVSSSVVQNFKDILLVSNENSDNVTIIDQLTYKILDVLKTNKGPRGMVYAEQNQLLFVANSKSDNISIYNILNLQKIKDISLNNGDEPSRLILSDDEQYLYILNYGSKSLSIVNLLSYQEESRVYDFEDLYAIALDETKGYLYISEPLSNKVRIFDPVNNTIVSEISFDGHVTELAFNNITEELIVAAKYRGLLFRYNSKTGEFANPVNLCSPASGISFNTFGDNLFVSEKDCKIVAIVDPEKSIEISTIYLDDEPGLIAQDSDNRNLFLIYPDNDVLSIFSIHSKTLVKTIDVGKRPYTALDIW
ncbi:MAG: YncE family protein [Calditrichaeota bacterium]|nr:MAG: YncE family protein [Calditrichota bacterium]